MRNLLAFTIAVLIAPIVPVSAITLAPGQSGFPDLVSTADTGTTLADTSYTAYVFTTDVGTPETFDSRVTRATDGSLTFWYVASAPNFFLSIPQSITLPGFAGLTTNIQQFNQDPFSPAIGITAIPLAGNVSRSMNGDSLTLSVFLPIDPPADTFTSKIILAVTTNAANFQLSDTGYEPTYVAYPYSPPGGPTEPFLSEQPRPAFIPASPAIPEPLSLLTLPLALTALSLRRRPLTT